MKPVAQPQSQLSRSSLRGGFGLALFLRCTCACVSALWTFSADLCTVHVDVAYTWILPACGPFFLLRTCLSVWEWRPACVALLCRRASRPIVLSAACRFSPPLRGGVFPTLLALLG